MLKKKIVGDDWYTLLFCAHFYLNYCSLRVNNNCDCFQSFSIGKKKQLIIIENRAFHFTLLQKKKKNV